MPAKAESLQADDRQYGRIRFAFGEFFEARADIAAQRHDAQIRPFCQNLRLPAEAGGCGPASTWAPGTPPQPASGRPASGRAWSAYDGAGAPGG